MVRSLNAHPSVACFGEVLKPNPRLEDLERLDLDGDALAQLSHRHQHASASFADTLFDQADRKDFQAVGFKLFYYHARESGRDGSIWDAVQERPTWRFIHLYRQDAFGAYLSRQLAAVTNSWHHGIGRAGDPDYQAQVTIDIEDYHTFRERLQDSIRWADDALPQDRTLTTTYEEFTADFAAGLRRLQLFLGVDEHSTPPPLAKQARRPWQEYVLNAEEVEDALKATPSP